MISKIKTLEDLKKVRIIGVHSGVFHLDDVISVAFISHAKTIAGDEETVRFIRLGRAKDNTILLPVDLTKEDMKSLLLVDCGGGTYDHHDDDPSRFGDVTDKNTKMCAFGELANDIMPLLFPKPLCKWFNKSIVDQINKTDNYGQGAFPNPLAAIVKCHNGPDINDDQDQMTRFIDVVNKVTMMLSGVFEWMLSPDVYKQCTFADQNVRPGDTFILNNTEKNVFISSMWLTDTDVKLVFNYNRKKNEYKILSCNSKEYNLQLIDKEGLDIQYISSFLCIVNNFEDACEFMQRAIGVFESRYLTENYIKDRCL